METKKKYDYATSHPKTSPSYGGKGKGAGKGGKTDKFAQTCGGKKLIPKF